MSIRSISLLLLLILLLGSSAHAADQSFGSVVTTTEANWGASVTQVIPWTTPAFAGTVDSVMIRVRDGGSNNDVQGVIYASTASAPGGLIDSTAKLLITSNTQTTYKLAFIGGGSVSASTEYYIGWCNSTANTLIPTTINSAGVGVTYKSSTTQVPSPFGTATGTDAGYEFYCLVWYTESGGGGGAQIIRTVIIE